MARLGVITSLLGLCLGAVLILHLFTTLKQVEDPELLFPASDKVERADNAGEDKDAYLLGVGKADITGPVVEINLMGYANMSQVGKGLRQRIYSRAFIVGNPNSPENRFVYIVLDAHSGDPGVRHGILKGLADLGGEYRKYGQHNVALTGTHSHSGPGAFLNYLLPQVTSLGLNKDSYQAIVDGAIKSIKKAHESLTPGHLSFGTIEVEEGNINRSPYSYLANPKDERERYGSDTENTLSLLKFDRLHDQKTMGVLTFFGVHGTSLLGNNSLVTGDNKGVAAYLFERSVRKDARFASDFVAGFSQSSVGDSSPNVLGAFCEDGSEKKCKFEDSTCGGKTQDCHGRGPFFREKDNGAKSCFEIGRRQFSAAKDLYNKMDKDSVRIGGSSSVYSFHTFRDLEDFKFHSPFNHSRVLMTCPAALGFSFAAGTTDGPGAFDFTQDGDSPSQSNALWYAIRGILHEPSRKQQQCQGPKTILLDIGVLDIPYEWAPDIVDIQLLRVGQLVIIVAAGEATTMAARRWKEAIALGAKDELSISDPIVLLGGPANTYAHYITTEEEYGIQRYEGGSTLHGPHTLAAHVNLTLTYLPYLSEASNTLPSMPRGPLPEINTDRSLSFISPVVRDAPPLLKSFGDVISSPAKDVTFRPGDTVKTTFVGANPRNNFRLDSTFATVERRIPGTANWEVVRDDADWNLIYHWERKNTVLATSEVTIEWIIEDDYYSVGDAKKLETGVYRMRYYGDSKKLNGEIHEFEGTGPDFNVRA